MASVRYLVKDVDDAVAFYTRRLGFTLEQQFGPNMAILARDGLTLWVAGLRQDGVRFRNEIVVGPGGRQILCEDPSGNVVELFEAA